MGSEKEVWLRTNEISEFIETLEFAAGLTSGLRENVTRWKWLILALHSATQGACVCALRGADTSGCSVLQNKKEMWHWLDVESRKPEHGPPPKEILAKMLELYKRCKKKNYLSEPLPLDPQRDCDMKRLNSIRNDFIHFVPKGLSIEVSGMPRIVRNCCSAIEHLAVAHPTFDHHIGIYDKNRIFQSIQQLRSTMELWERASQ